MTEQYKIYEATLTGPDQGNPYREVWMKADFTDGTRSYSVNGFYCGEGVYKIRFMPMFPGQWRAVTCSNVPELDQVELICDCVPAGEGNHGRVLTETQISPGGEDARKDSESRFRFAYEDGTRFLPFGTTCYAWIYQPERVQEQTLDTLKDSGFNKVRMCIFPKFYTYNMEDPRLAPFEGNAAEGFDFTRFCTDFWNNLELRINQLDEMGIQADLILFHPYDKWGFSRMDPETDAFYLKYVVDRLCHFKNVWWSLANEYDLMPWKTEDDWERYARMVTERDPYGHLRSIHNCLTFYDHTRDWITHASIQRVDVYRTAENVTQWRQQYQKPIVVDECAYEGNINFGWGNITGEEMVRRFWEGCIRGGYLSHGEVYVQYPQIWWSHGGTLHGTAPERIAFLKKIMEEAPVDAAPLALTPQNHLDNWDVPCMCTDDGSWFLYYFGFMRPSFRTWKLPEGGVYEIERIDTWEMTVEKLPGTYSGSIRIDLPGRQYIAVRMKRAGTIKGADSPQPAHRM